MENACSEVAPPANRAECTACERRADPACWRQRARGWAWEFLGQDAEETDVRARAEEALWRAVACDRLLGSEGQWMPRPDGDLHDFAALLGRCVRNRCGGQAEVERLARKGHRELPGPRVRAVALEAAGGTGGIRQLARPRVRAVALEAAAGVPARACRAARDVEREVGELLQAVTPAERRVLEAFLATGDWAGAARKCKLTKGRISQIVKAIRERMATHGLE